MTFRCDAICHVVAATLPVIPSRVRLAGVVGRRRCASAEQLPGYGDRGSLVEWRHKAEAALPPAGVRAPLEQHLHDLQLPAASGDMQRRGGMADRRCPAAADGARHVGRGRPGQGLLHLRRAALARGEQQGSVLFPPRDLALCMCDGWASAESEPRGEWVPGCRAAGGEGHSGGHETGTARCAGPPPRRSARRLLRRRHGRPPQHPHQPWPPP